MDESYLPCFLWQASAHSMFTALDRSGDEKLGPHELIAFFKEFMPDLMKKDERYVPRSPSLSLLRHCGE